MHHKTVSLLGFTPVHEKRGIEAGDVAGIELKATLIARKLLIQ